MQDKDMLIKRLNRIEGQVKGIQKMVDEERYCIDILTQISAIRSAINKVGSIILENHIKGCVVNSIKDLKMNQQGYIVEIVDSVTAKLKLKRHFACASCGKCATTSEEKYIIVEADNTIGAKVGDRVEVNMETVNVLKAAFIAYTIPLLALLLGTVGTFYGLKAINITNNVEIISGGAGLIFTTLSFLILKKNDKKFRESKEYIPIVIRIIASSGSEINL